MTELTFTAARALAYAELAATWPADRGELITLDEGRQDDDGYLVIYGAREALLDGNADYDLIDPELVFVSKRTGSITRATLLDAEPRLDRMTLVRDAHPGASAT